MITDQLIIVIKVMILKGEGEDILVSNNNKVSNIERGRRRHLGQ